MDKIIDVSTYQGVIEWDKVKESGIDGAIIKIINKSRVRDKRFESNYSGATAQGLPVGVYNYSYATSVSAAKLDAESVVSFLSGRKATMGVWLDVEDNCQKGLGQKLIDIINAYIKVVEAAGYACNVYTGLYFYNTYIKPYKTQLNCKFWVARYPKSSKMSVDEDPNTAYKPNIYHELYAWQYSSTTQVPGIDGNCDISILYGSTTLTAGSSSKTTTTVKTTYLTQKQAIKKGQEEANAFVGTSIKEDGIVGQETKKEMVRVLQKALNLDYKSALAVDGIYGSKTKAALGVHYVMQGQTQYLVTAAEILLYLNGYNPNGVETPGKYGSGLATAVKKKFSGTGTKMTATMFAELIS